MTNLYVKRLCVTNNSDFKDHARIGSDYLFERWSSVRAVLEQNISEEYRFFFARPEFDKDSDTISWYTKEWTEEGSPVQIGRLDEEETEKYRDIFENTLAYYRDVVSKLKRGSDDYKILSSAIRDLDNKAYIDNFVFVVDGHVVCVAWGMLLTEKNKSRIDTILMDVPKPPIKRYTIRFKVDEHGRLDGQSSIRVLKGYTILQSDVPLVSVDDGYEFKGWDIEPEGYVVEGKRSFVARIEKMMEPEPHMPPEPIDDPTPEEPINPEPPIIEDEPKKPWYKRIWLWLLGVLSALWLWFSKRGWKWLLGLLIFLLLCWLLSKCTDGTYSSLLPEGCRKHVPVIYEPVIDDSDSDWIEGDDNVRAGVGGIYDPGRPYEEVPSPTAPGSGYEDLQPVLPDRPNELKPIDGEPEIRPGQPTIIANRLNILMENEQKSVLDLVRAFKREYAGEQYEVVYYDDVIKRIQIEVPSEEREEMKRRLPEQFSEYEIFVFDETLFEGSYVPNDPAVRNEQSWYLNTIGAFEAWDITMGSEDVVVAVVDNGFNLKHPEFKGKVVMPYNVWSHNDNIFAQEVDHGSHVAGIAIGKADNGKGISGIAPGCKFMPIQVADRNGMMTTTSVLDGIIYALYQGADVINVSLGQQFTGLSMYDEEIQKQLIDNHFKEEERLWREVMRIAERHNSTTIVVAAGNDNVLAGIEALQRPELFVKVSAVDRSSTPIVKTDFSNYGDYSTISAPGVDIYSACKDGYEKMDGTSMAAPIVSGAIALMKSVRKDITNQQIICTLQSTGKPSRDKVGNLIQIERALKKVETGEMDDCTPEPSGGDVQILLSWNNYNDLDLFCIDPNNDIVCFRQKRVPSGGQLEIDMNVSARHSNHPIENIYWPEGGAPEGTYHVGLVYYSQHEQGDSGTPYKVVVRYGGKEEVYEGTISYKEPKDPIVVCSFTLGTASSAGVSSGSVDANREAERARTRAQLERRREELERELENVNNELRNL